MFLGLFLQPQRPANGNRFNVIIGLLVAVAMAYDLPFEKVDFLTDIMDVFDKRFPGPVNRFFPITRPLTLLPVPLLQ